VNAIDEDLSRDVVKLKKLPKSEIFKYGEKSAFCNEFNQ
jgi:hypothetical protein